MVGPMKGKVVGGDTDEKPQEVDLATQASQDVYAISGGLLLVPSPPIILTAKEVTPPQWTQGDDQAPREPKETSEL